MQSHHQISSRPPLPVHNNHHHHHYKSAYDKIRSQGQVLVLPDQAKKAALIGTRFGSSSSSSNNNNNNVNSSTMNSSFSENHSLNNELEVPAFFQVSSHGEGDQAKKDEVKHRVAKINEVLMKYDGQYHYKQRNSTSTGGNNNNVRYFEQIRQQTIAAIPSVVAALQEQQLQQHQQTSKEEFETKITSLENEKQQLQTNLDSTKTTLQQFIVLYKRMEELTLKWEMEEKKSKELNAELELAQNAEVEKYQLLAQQEQLKRNEMEQQIIQLQEQNSQLQHEVEQIQIKNQDLQVQKNELMESLTKQAHTQKIIQDIEATIPLNHYDNTDSNDSNNNNNNQDVLNHHHQTTTTTQITEPSTPMHERKLDDTFIGDAQLTGGMKRSLSLRMNAPVSLLKSLSVRRILHPFRNSSSNSNKREMNGGETTDSELLQIQQYDQIRTLQYQVEQYKIKYEEAVRTNNEMLKANGHVMMANMHAYTAPNDTISAIEKSFQSDGGVMERSVQKLAV
jgi:hypothetical protein